MQPSFALSQPLKIELNEGIKLESNSRLYPHKKYMVIENYHKNQNTNVKIYVVWDQQDKPEYYFYLDGKLVKNHIYFNRLQNNINHRMVDSFYNQATGCFDISFRFYDDAQMESDEGTQAICNRATIIKFYLNSIEINNEIDFSENTKKLDDDEMG